MIEQGNVSHASDYAKRSLILSKELGFPVNIKNAAELMSIIFEKQNRGMEALEMHKLYFNMHDSILNEETQKTVVKQEAKYEYQKKKVIDDAERDKLIAIEKEKKEKQEIITYSTAFGLVLVIGFLLFVFNRLKITRKQKC